MSGPGLRVVAVIGGGPAGARFAVELTSRRPGLRVDIFERKRRARGGGIVLADDVVDRLGLADPVLATLPATARSRWDRTLTYVGDERIWSGAFGMWGIAREAFNDRLLRLALDRPGVRLVERECTHAPTGYDLVVAADGARSRLRHTLAHRFGETTTTGTTLFRWFTTPSVLQPMFALRPTRHGLLIVHAYPHGAHSTFIVEAHPTTLSAYGPPGKQPDTSPERLAALFARELAGAPLVPQTGWQAFRTVEVRHWHAHRTVLIGDAAHTVHFSIGSGTALALDDATALAAALAGHDDPAEAIAAFAAERAPVVARAHDDASASRRWFEQLADGGQLRGAQTVFDLRSRRDVNTFARLRQRDPEFTAAVLRGLGAGAGIADPTDVPITLGTLRLPGRDTTLDRVVPADDPRPADGGGCVVLAPPPGHPMPDRLHELADRLRRGGARAVGLLVATVDDARAVASARHPAAGPGVDFVAVPAQPGPSRLDRAGLAARVRRTTGLPVLLLPAPETSADELNTLIAAGRIDLYARGQVADALRRRCLASAARPADHDRRRGREPVAASASANHG
jgi:2-polyprenyl-6-methoxyphenol hydroxylase-like FAD-dependent oxidoreductase